MTFGFTDKTGYEPLLEKTQNSHQELPWRAIPDEWVMDQWDSAGAGTDDFTPGLARSRVEDTPRTQAMAGHCGKQTLENSSQANGAIREELGGNDFKGRLAGPGQMRNMAS